MPFRGSDRIGWVVEHGGATEVTGIKAVRAVLDEEPSVSEALLELARWMSGYYVTPLGLVIRASLPSVLSDVSRSYLAATGAPYTSKLRPRAQRVLDWLTEREGATRMKSARQALSMGSIWPEVRTLVAAGLVTHRVVPPSDARVRTRRVVRVERELHTLLDRENVFGRARRQSEAYDALLARGGSAELSWLTGDAGFSRGVVTGLEEKGLVSLADEEEVRDPFARVEPPAVPSFTLTPDQTRALDTLRRGLGTRSSKPFLLQGVTGSGKTIVYIEVIREALREGRGAIVLVPEISLTPQTVSRFRAHFGEEVAVLHSGLSAGERYDAWRLLRSGQRRVAVGARSAIFAPMARLGVVVVDEEHDGSYKQADAPRYNARDLAVVRAKAEGAVCILGSATPSLESWHNATTGKFERILLPERVGGGRLPDVRVVDMRSGGAKEGRSEVQSGRTHTVLSDELVDAVRVRLARREQVILLLNRRGYSAFVQCRECGEVEQCDNCSISLTYHRSTRRVMCHHCRYEAAAPSRCPRCGSDDLSFRGLGTEQVERVTTESFPSARVARMDVDTTSGKWAHQRILERFERGEIDILLGTQMIAKGLDFPRVTLVGVVNADVGMHLPDFRASERTFQLLSQVAGRAGRSALSGEVLVQTALPDHYVVQAAVRHDTEGFARQELEERRSAEYPPHNRLMNVVVSSPDQELAAETATRAADWVRGTIERWGRSPDTRFAVGVARVTGPAPSPIERLHGRWRWHFLLRSAHPSALGAVGRAFSTHFRPPAEVRIVLDRDPVALL